MKIRTTLLAAIVPVCLVSLGARAQKLEPWIEGGLQKPVDFAADPGDPERFYVVEQTGTVRVIQNGQLLEAPFFEVDRSDFTTDNWEQGLLGIALDPDYSESGLFYLNYSGADGRTKISRVRAETAHVADASSEEVLLEIAQPWGNHNGGCIRFGPDGMLYVGMGDGGSANDPRGAGQDMNTLLGKLLRIDVRGEADEGLAYGVPDDNPYVDQSDVRPEIWSYGVRNPWRFEFDAQGRMWIADVGQNRFEWVHVQRADSRGGENYGWNIMEGRGRFRPGRAQFQDPPRLDAETFRERGVQMPVFEYRHHPVASITGGYVYEGNKIARLEGRYICADFMSGRVWSFRLNDDWQAEDVVEHTDAFAQTFGGDGPQLAISSFGRGTDGELYVLDHKKGRVLKIVE